MSEKMRTELRVTIWFAVGILIGAAGWPFILATLIICGLCFIVGFIIGIVEEARR